MRVGIITLSLENNYGGILQNFALQKVLKDMGHTPMTCRWPGYTNLGFIKAALFSVLKGGRNFPTPPWTYNKSRKGLEDFIKQNIDYRFYRDPNKFLRWFNPQAMIVGSDQVWRPKYNSHLYFAYLDFVKDKYVKRIAYAASFGVGEWEYTKEQETICSELIGQFYAVSVREQSGVELCEEHLGVSAQCVLDPTLLLDREVYEELCSSIPKEDESILVYMVDYSEAIKQQAEKLSQSTGLPIKIIEADKGVTQNDSVAKWLAAFRDAKYVITDSFHGTVFSIIFEKNFVAIGNERRGYDRFVSLLGSFHLADKLVEENNINSINNNVLSSLDYTCINKIKCEKVYDSREFISMVLND